MGSKRAPKAGLAVLLLAGSVTSCIDSGRGTLFVDFDPSGSSAEVVDSEDGPRIRIELGVYVDSDGDVLLDSALVVVNHDGVSDALADPDIETDDFPIARSGQADISLSVPSPITDFTSFDAFCAANGRSVDVTLRFFATSIDPDPDLPPPLTEITTSLPLPLSGSPDAPNVIGEDGVDAFGVGPDPIVKNVVPGPGGTILFVVSTDDPAFDLRAYGADIARQDVVGLEGFEAYPRVASNDPDLRYIAGVDQAGPLSVRRVADGIETSMTIEHEDASPQYQTFNVVALEPTADGVRAAVVSSFPLLDPGVPDFEGGVPADKYYGSFLIEGADVDGVLTPTVVVPLDREIVSWVPLSDGRFQITNELPPRSPETTLRVERLDAAGAVVWTHDEPVAAHDVDADTLADGTVVVAYELSSGFIEVLRLSASDGSEVSRASFSGQHPTVAPYGSDDVLLSFNGRVPELDQLAPARPVPLLLELDAGMGVVRGTQIACSGSADLQRASDGSLMLVGAFGERFSLGESVTEVAAESLILTKIAEPL